MKWKTLLVFSGILAIAVTGCRKDPIVDPLPVVSEDEDLAGESVTVGETGFFTKLFVLNEGKMGTNNATLDFFRFANGKYVRNAFDRMNPSQALGLGDVGNDIKIFDGKIWAVINNSGLVEVMDAFNEKHIATIPVRTPRNIAFDGNYAYVTSYAGAFVNYQADYTVGEHLICKGRVYKINRSSYAVVDSVDVGYQPEGIAWYDGRLYVANSGGLSYAVTYQYESTVSVIDAGSFKPIGTVEVAPNLKEVFADPDGNIYVTSLGDYYMNHSGIFSFRPGDTKATRVRTEGMNCNVTCAALSTRPGNPAVPGNEVFVIGTEEEWNWDPAADKNYYLFSVSGGNKVTRYSSFRYDGSVPYGLCAAMEGSGLKYLFVGDAVDYVNPGAVSCYAAGDGFKRVWSTTSGVDPGHFCLY